MERDIKFIKLILRLEKIKQGLLDTFIENNTRDIIVDMREVKDADEVTWSVLSAAKMNQNNKGNTLQVTNFELPDLVKEEWKIDD